MGEAERSLIKRVQGQKRFFAEHLERSDFCNFDKSRKRAYQKEKIESNKQSKEGGQLKSVCGKWWDARQRQKSWRG